MHALALAIIAFVLSLSHSWAAPAGLGQSVRAETSPNEGRLIFGWDTPTTVLATPSGRRLTLQFGRALTADLFVPMARLAPWLSNLAASARPGEVSLELRDGVSADVLEGTAATTIVVALRHRPAGTGTTIAVTPSRGPVLNVRSGTHPGFGRLVLESDVPSQFDIRRERDELLVATRALLSEHAPTQALALSRWIAAAAVEGQALKLRLRPGVVVREERATAAKLVLDFAIPVPRTSAPMLTRRASGAPADVAEAASGTRNGAEGRGAVVPPPFPESEGVAPSRDPAHPRLPEVAPHAGPKVHKEGAGGGRGSGRDLPLAQARSGGRVRASGHSLDRLRRPGR